MGEKQWISVHLYYNQPWTDFLLKRVFPFVKPTLDTGLVEHFFFVRYWHRGPHIRLRFFGQKNQLDEILIPNLRNYFEDYFDYHPSYRNDPSYPEGFPDSEKWFPNNSVKVLDYEPEYFRYGGAEGVTIAERQFFSSSKVVIQKFLEKGKNWDYESGLGSGVLLHLTMLHAMQFDKTEALHFFNMCYQTWLPKVIARKRKEFKEESLETIRNRIAIDFQRSFRVQKDQIVGYANDLWKMLDEDSSFEEDFMNEWYLEQRAVGEELKNLQSQGKLKPRPKSMQYIMEAAGIYSDQKLDRWMHIADYLHMTNNRLGILNRDESFLSFLLAETIQRIV